MDFAHKPGVALVTGGSGGIGAAICRRLAAMGADVAFTYRANAAAAREVSDAIAAAGRRADATALDLSDLGALEGWVAGAHERFGAIHTVVHSAGPYVNQVFASRVDVDAYRRHLEDETVSFFALVKAALPALREQRGALVAVTSVANRKFPVRDVLSASPKAAVESLMRALAVEEGKFGVRFNCVGPGLMRTGMMNTLVDRGEIREKDLDHAVSSIPLGRFGTADDIAEAVCFLASDRAAYITGQYLDVDGGYSV